MTELFCSFLDFRSLNSSLNLAQLHRRHYRSYAFAHSHISRASGLNKRSVSLSLFSKPRAANIDVISTHEHSDGSFIFRFGDASEVAKNVKIEGINAENEVEGKGKLNREKDLGNECESNVAVKTADREVVDDTNSIAVSSENITAVGEINSSEEFVEGLNDNVLPASILSEEEEVVSTSDVEIEGNGHLEAGVDEDRKVSASSEMANSVTVDVTTLVSSVSSESLIDKEACVDSEHQELGTETRDEIVEDGREIIENEMVPPSLELQSSVSSSEGIEDENLQNLNTGIENETYVDTQLQNVVTVDCAGADIEATSCPPATTLNGEAQASEAPTKFPREPVFYVTEADAKSSPTPTTLVAEAQISDASTESPGKAVDDGNGSGVTEADVEVTSVPTASTVDAEAQASEAPIELQNDVVEDGNGSGMVELETVPPQLETDPMLDVTGADIEGKSDPMATTLVAEAQASDALTLSPNEAVEDGNGSGVVKFVSPQLATEPLLDVTEADIEAKSDPTATTLDAEAQASDAPSELQNEVAEDGNGSGMVELETVPQLATEPMLDFTEADTELKSDPTATTLVAEAQASDSSTESPNEAVEDGNGSGVVELETVSPQLATEPMPDVTEAEIEAKSDPTATTLAAEAQASDASTEFPNGVVEDGNGNGMLELETVPPQLGTEPMLDVTEADIEAKSSLNPTTLAAAQAQISDASAESPNEVVEEGNGNGMVELETVPPQLESDSMLDDTEADIVAKSSPTSTTLVAEAQISEPSLDEETVVADTKQESTDDNIAESLKLNDDLVEALRYEVAELKSTESATVSQEAITIDFVLSSGAAIRPHSSKALTGGEDAYFIADNKWLGVADGVGQWSLEGISPGVYAQELLKNCERIISDCNSNSVNNPLELVNLAAAETLSSGASTVLIARFDGQALHVANIGDSGFAVLRHGAVYKRSSPMLHAFHFPLLIERGVDPSGLAELYKVYLEEDDVIITATDGLFDNLYDQEISSIVMKSLAADKMPEEIADLLATRAQEKGGTSSMRCPFADDAQAAGYTGYTGGKLDDVAVIVSVVGKQPNPQT